MRNRIKNLSSSVWGWVQKNKIECLLLVSILLLGGFFRLYKIGEYMTFLGDEGRDAIVVRRLITDLDPILVGPGTSIGNMYLGPLYYYLIAPFLLLFNLSPLGPSVLIALIGIVTIFFVWFVVREWFPSKENQVNVGSLVAALLYSVSPVVIKFSKSSWNPNVMPFFSLLAVYSIWKIYIGKSRSWFLVLAISIAFILNSHYLGLLLLPVIGLFWFLRYLEERNTKKEKSYLKSTLLAVLMFLFLMSPLLIFDARHEWRNTIALKEFFTKRQETVSIRPWTAFPKIDVIYKNINTSLVSAGNIDLGSFVTFIYEILIIAASVKILFAKQYGMVHKAFFLLFVWLGVALIGLGLYKQHIYDHYYGFFFAVPFILLGGFLQTFLPAKKGIWHLASGVVITYLVFINLVNSPLKQEPNRQMQRAARVAEVIAEKSNGDKFNLAVIADNNYEDGYQYFLEKDRLPVYDIDPLDYDKTLANQLFVVCEMAKEKCDPVNSPKAGIANFGWSKIEEQWEVGGIFVYKLVHTN
jgi:4-amino-4-deoxy-L-arabinose transferase-like glycosyltransferase